MANIKEKVKKLLALASSPNEHEAKAALLKARELMAAHKLSDVDLKEEVLTHITCPDIKWTSDSGNSWMADLCRVLCDSYCCASAWGRVKGCRTYTLEISGLSDDVELCKLAVEYAVEFINSRIKNLSSRKTDKSTVQSYARGFINGLQTAFEDQQDNHSEWGLVMVKPEEVRQYENSLTDHNVTCKKANFNPLAYLLGQKDGMEFDIKRLLETN